MKPFSLYKRWEVAVSILAVAVLLLPAISMATGPRVSPGLFEPIENEIHAAEQPPFISATADKPGLVTAIVNAALQAGGVEALVTTQPLRRMVKYHLTQEQSIAALGSRFGFTDAQNESLIFVPLFVSPAHYLYYKPAHKAGLKWDGTLMSLKGLRYGALKGEDVGAYEHAGIKVVFGSERSLLKKLKSGEIDFIRLTPLAKDWLLDKHFGGNRVDFRIMDRAAGEVVFNIIFNTQHKNGEAVAAHVRSALAEMVGDGRYAKILESHLGKGGAVQVHLQSLEKHLSR